MSTRECLKYFAAQLNAGKSTYLPAISLFPFTNAALSTHADDNTRTMCAIEQILSADGVKRFSQNECSRSRDRLLNVSQSARAVIGVSGDIAVKPGTDDYKPACPACVWHS